MARQQASSHPFNIMIVGQNGRLQYEALLFVASLRAHSPNFRGRMIVVEPQAGPNWAKDPTMTPEIKAALVEMVQKSRPLTACILAIPTLTAIKSRG